MVARRGAVAALLVLTLLAGAVKSELAWAEPTTERVRGVAKAVAAVRAGDSDTYDPRPIRDQIAEAGNNAHPKEACGFILSTGHVVECLNVDEAPWYRFAIDPDEARAWWETGLVTGVWHSHPDAPAVPSEEDAEQAVESVETLVYSVTDEDLGTYRKSGGVLLLVKMESPE